jgi:hypothetical protein
VESVDRKPARVAYCRNSRRAQRLICWAVVIARLARIKDSKP